MNQCSGGIATKVEGERLIVWFAHRRRLAWLKLKWSIVFCEIEVHFVNVIQKNDAQDKRCKAEIEMTRKICFFKSFLHLLCTAAVAQYSSDAHVLEPRLTWHSRAPSAQRKYLSLIWWWWIEQSANYLTTNTHRYMISLQLNTTSTYLACRKKVIINLNVCYVSNCLFFSL